MILLTLFLLAVMEISLSFDNAVLNAAVLKTMSPKWQRRFLLWGMPVAVVGMRLAFPILIVATATKASLLQTFNMAVYDPSEYARHLDSAHILIAAFGGMFLLMIFLKFLFDSSKKVHWIQYLEQHATFMGKIEAIEICIAATIILILQSQLPIEQRLTFQTYGIIGIITYVTLNGITDFCGLEHSSAPQQGIAAFIYLEVLDASCSLDGVIGAFVLTNNIFLIMIGLGIGSFAIRSLTLYLVRGGILKEYIYLEHGANYGIGVLGIIMLTDIFYPVPEPITGMAGIGFIGLSLLSSIKHNKRSKVVA